MSSAERYGLVNDTLPHSLVDGPGNRFVVFMQGCDFDCVACHNPYTIHVCHHCGECVGACNSGALRFDGAEVHYDATRCSHCDDCVRACSYDSTPKAASVSTAALVERVRAVAPYLSGVTVSGGEATQQAPFVQAFFARLAADPELARLSRFVDSNGAAPDEVWDALEAVMDGAMIDLKAFDDDVHRRLTGVGNAAVLRTIERLATRGALYEVRLLIVPGLNDDHDMLERTARWLAAVDPQLRVTLIAFRRHGTRAAGRALDEPTAEAMHAHAAALRAAGLERVAVV